MQNRYYTFSSVLDPNANMTDAYMTYDNRSVAPEGESGCVYCWCLEMNAMSITQFMVGFSINAIGYPFNIAILGSLFSKIVGNYRQGFYMGLLTMSGSFARDNMQQI